MFNVNKSLKSSLDASHKFGLPIYIPTKPWIVGKFEYLYKLFNNTVTSENPMNNLGFFAINS